jgi:hypothetical protein
LLKLASWPVEASKLILTKLSKCLGAFKQQDDLV